MNLKKSFLVFVNLLLFFLIALTFVQTYSVYLLSDKRIRSTKQEQIEHVYELYKPRLIGNILLQDRQLVEDLLKAMANEQGMRVELDGKIQAHFEDPNLSPPFVEKTFPLDFGNEKLGELRIKANVPFLFDDVFKDSVPLIFAQIVLSIFCCVLLLAHLKKRFIVPLDQLNKMIVSNETGSMEEYSGFPEELKKIAAAHFLAQDSLKKLTEFKAVASTTQSFAHDVRKPFSMFKMIIDAVEGQDNPIVATRLLKESLPEVQQAMASVNGMISDVLEIGSESAPIVELTNPETLIEATLHEIFRVYPESKVKITYFLNHKHKVNVDTLKMGRVFSNIVGNAVQAMNQKGELWFKTEELEESGKPLIKFCLGNGGTWIPPENLSKLFDAFFTSGKKGGTGLGLAIAQKMVIAHGGKIWCESDPQRGVEFFFTLPRANERCDARATPLPPSSEVITASIERSRKVSRGDGRVEADPLEVTLEKEIIKLTKVAKGPLKILVVDDEGVYRNSLSALIIRSEDLKANVALSFARNSHEALEGVTSSTDLIIQDVDLGVNSINGYEVLKTLRAKGYVGVACIHSNRTTPDDYKVAVEAGADAVLPKPMSRTHFLKLLLQAAEQTHKNTNQASLTPRLPEFAFLDDSRLIQMAWQMKMDKVALVHVFSSPKEFHAHVKANEDFLARLDFIVTDFYFAKGVLETGFTFAEHIRPIFHKPILLCSDGDFTPEMIRGRVDAVVSKEPIDWERLAPIVELAVR